MLAATRLHCSVGIGDNKLRAKIATEFGKPRGSYVLTAETWFEVMGDRPTRALWGIGSKTAKKLAALGIDTVEQLARSDARMLAAELGPTMGPWYHRLGRGVSDSPVSAEPWVPRAHGRETTFQTDLEDWDQIAEEVRVLTRRVVEDIDREGRPAARVGLKLRYRPFITITRSLTLPQSDQRPGRRWPRPRCRCSTGSSTTGRSGCSASGWRWSSPRAATERRQPRLVRSSPTTESTTATRSPSVASATARWRWYDAPRRGMSRTDASSAEQPSRAATGSSRAHRRRPGRR